MTTVDVEHSGASPAVARLPPRSADGPVAHEPSDEHLMGRVQRGDQEAFALLYERHATVAYRAARALCRDPGRAEEAVQEGFLSIWDGRAGFRPEGGTFKSWAVTAVRNRAVDLIRHDAAGKRPDFVELRERGAEQAAPAAGGDNDREEMIAALHRLPARQAEVIVLAFYGELSQAEIAAELVLPAGTVKGRMRLGLNKLRRQMNGHGAISKRERSDPRPRAFRTSSEGPSGHPEFGPAAAEANPP